MRTAFATTLFLCLGVPSGAQTGRMRTADFSEVHAILQSRCRVCHTGSAAQAGLRIDTRDDLLRGGKSGPAVVPGKSADSLLFQKIMGQRGTRMPPSGPPLNDDVIATLRQWIDQGAVWGTVSASSGRLAPIAPRIPPLPAGASENPIDRFVTAGARVSDAVFARRTYLDLHGLLPPPEELQSFIADREAGKRELLIERLLADREKYAEHWISFWNDLLRNDEGVIYHGERKTITTWLLGALRTNMPYDVMVRALLNPVEKDDPEGFLIGVNWRGVVSASQSPPMQAAQNAAQVFLGMNLKCAACHDSFVNRWKLKDTFGLAAMFANEKLELVRCDVPTGQTAEARFPLTDLKAAAFDTTLESRRAAAAQWFTTPENGRFARTLVNRYWRLLFGRGIVEPVDDMDAEPWSQDLLDWLASDFAQHGYDLQHLLHRIMTSNAYQMPAVMVKEAGSKYAFRGPQPRRLTAEQFEDAISSVSGDWRVRVPRSEVSASYAREWRLKSDPLSRVLGRPIRDQVYTERSTEATTLQALEMTNGPLLSERLERAAKALLGQLPPAPRNRFDSKLVRSGSTPIDVDITGAKELWLVIEDVDSYDPDRVIAGWANAELTGPEGTVRLAQLPGPAVQTREFALAGPAVVPGIQAPAPSKLKWALAGRQFTRFTAQAVIDEQSRKSDISPAVRFFVFTEEPEADRLVHVEGETPLPQPKTQWTSDELVTRLYLHLFSRLPAPAERKLALGTLGPRPAPERLEDLLWAMLMSPEFQFIQ